MRWKLPGWPWIVWNRRQSACGVLAHPHRLRMVEMLLKDRYSVGELAQACDIPSHMASEHLMLMKRCGFLNANREGRNVFYSVKEPHLSSIMACIQSRFGEEA